MQLSPFSRPSDQQLHANRFRQQRIRRFMQLVDGILATKPQCRILDIGGTHAYWNGLAEFWQGRNIGVTLLNLSKEGVADPRFESVAGDACAIPFADRTFDLVHSNSVIEHVGSWQQMQRMAGEVRRLAPRYFVQTPNYWFPIEPHARFPLLHMLPGPLRIRIHLGRRTGFYPRAENLDQAMQFAEDARLLDARQMRHLFPDAALEREKAMGLTKSLVAIR